MAFYLWPCQCLGNFSQVPHLHGIILNRSIYSRGMQDKIQKEILNAFLVVLRPVAKIMLRCGIGFREFAEIAKTAFVDVASREYGIRGRPTNISRIAVMTGLTRKEVRRLRDKISNGDHAIVVKTTPLVEVLHRWHAESEFLDSTGRPSVLPFNGDKRSFSSLVRQFGGDIPPGAMRTELKRVGAIHEEADGGLRAIKRSFRPEGDHNVLVSHLVHGIYPHISTLAHNTNAERKEPTWTQRTVFTQSVRESDKSRLRRISADRIIEFAESLDDLFMAYETLHENDQSSDDHITMAIGVFYFEEADRDAGYTW